MADAIQGTGPVHPDVREAVKKRLEEFEQESKAPRVDPLEPIDSLWGCGEIVAAFAGERGHCRGLL